jgi:hypothetical protein
MQLLAKHTNPGEHEQEAKLQVYNQRMYHDDWAGAINRHGPKPGHKTGQEVMCTPASSICGRRMSAPDSAAKVKDRSCECVQRKVGR